MKPKACIWATGHSAIAQTSIQLHHRPSYHRHRRDYHHHRQPLFLKRSNGFGIIIKWKKMNMSCLPALSRSPRMQVDAAFSNARINALPLVILVFSISGSAIVGACVLTKCLRAEGSGDAAFTHGGFHALVEPEKICTEDCLYSSAVFRLKPAVEKTVRMDMTRHGLILNSSLAQFSSSSWRAMRFSDTDCDALANQSADWFRKSFAICNAMGLTPDKTHELPSLPPEVEAAACEAFRGEEDDEARREGGAPDFNDLIRACMAESRKDGGGGIVAHRYTVPHMLAYLKFAQSLKPSAGVNNELADAAEVLLGPSTAPVQNELRAGCMPTSSGELLRMAKLRLDMCSMVFEQLSFAKWAHRRYLSYDASEMNGHDYLLVREDRFRYPRNADFGPDFWMRYDIASNWETRICLASVIGVGQLVQ